ncbi:uncharacterized protein F5Z01DRAFT_636586 [Emericellopsis atlantica]|uniref:Uncharacterized protein n=1 Tax=Emericellopsis atlantica TaxID=2614577 RepID=A0A9P7ZMX1_9HYPO|nr:uncharacterized protein F5Z01DRAFT_636586 [Emericellopsis atlantica]KAG9254510.1 hypothetical protein F5Z01DRAFT_636586 [Emericellopsis atlantica]
MGWQAWSTAITSMLTFLLQIANTTVDRCQQWRKKQAEGAKTVRDSPEKQNKRLLLSLFDFVFPSDIYKDSTGNVWRTWVAAEYTALKNALAEAYAEWRQSEKSLSRIKDLEDLAKKYQRSSSTESATLRKELASVKGESRSLRDKHKSLQDENVFLKDLVPNLVDT